MGQRLEAAGGDLRGFQRSDPLQRIGLGLTVLFATLFVIGFVLANAGAADAGKLVILAAFVCFLASIPLTTPGSGDFAIGIGVIGGFAAAYAGTGWFFAAVVGWSILAAVAISLFAVPVVAIAATEAVAAYFDARERRRRK